MAQSSSSLSSLYAELHRLGQNGEYDRALKVVNKILQEDPDDAKAFHCKVVCLVQQSEFKEALALIEKNPRLSSDLAFEKAYCLYRLNRIEDAWNLLKSVHEPSFRIKELMAQVLYRLERYQECFDAYGDLIKNSQDDFEDERETNLSAVVANLCAEREDEIPNAPQLREHTYELCYNQACILLGQKRYKEAAEKLRVAEEMCKKSLEEDEVPEDEIEQELGVIRTQMAFAKQMQNQPDKALKLYNSVLKQRPTDSALLAVASNNIVTINKDQNVFDSKKKIKAATAEGLESKLNSSQRRAIALNHCLILLQTNQLEQCRQQLRALRRRFPLAAAEAALVEATLLCKEKQIAKAVDVLKDYEAEHPDESLQTSFTHAQLLLSQGHVNQACNMLRHLGDVSYKPGVVSALVTLYLSLEDRDSATAILEEAVEWHKRNKPRGTALPCLMRECAQFLLKHGRPKEAAAMLEELCRSNPGDAKTLAQLITAYSHFNPTKAREVSKNLQPVEDLLQNVDVDALETTTWSMGAKYVKKGGKVEPSPRPSSDTPSSADIQKKKKKKKKKGKLPKNYDPSVDPDPERWLPKRERVAFKKRKDKRKEAVGKGTQGAVSGSTDMDASRGATRTAGGPNASPAAAVAGTQPSPNPQGPRQQRPQAAQKKKKKGRR